MSEPKRSVGRWVVVFALLAAGLFVCPCWPSVWVFTCYDPYILAAPVARQAAEARGYRMEGYMGDFVSEPDLLGGCEVRFQFVDLSRDPPDRRVVTRVRRGWCLGWWEVVEMREEAWPEK